jgi:Right handed beta helix region
MFRAARLIAGRGSALQPGGTRALDRKPALLLGARLKAGLRAGLKAGLLGGLAAAVAAGSLSSSALASASSGCSLYASPSGSDSANGSATSPFRTAQKLTNSLTPGEVGCLRAGTYGNGLRFEHGGSSSAPLVLRSAPGERALITGRVYVPHGSNYVTVADLDLDGNYELAGESALPSPTVDAAHTTFEGDSVTDDHTEICFELGTQGWGVAESTVITETHIYDCGHLPSRNQDHGIYISDAVDTVISDDVIDHNTDRGIQLYPDSTGAQITDNVIAENGEGIIFSGEGGVASSGNVVEHNVIVDSNIRDDVESWYPAGTSPGTGNVVQYNCISQGGINTSGGGFTASNNFTPSTHELTSSEEDGVLPVEGSSCAQELTSSPPQGGGGSEGGGHEGGGGKGGEGGKGTEGGRGGEGGEGGKGGEGSEGGGGNGGHGGGEGGKGSEGASGTEAGGGGGSKGGEGESHGAGGGHSNQWDPHHPGWRSHGHRWSYARHHHRHANQRRFRGPARASAARHGAAARAAHAHLAHGSRHGGAH